MGGVFRASDGLIYELYVEGVKCAFDNISFSYSSKGTPSLVVEVPATSGIKSVQKYDPVTEALLEDLSSQQEFIINQIQTAGSNAQTPSKEPNTLPTEEGSGYSGKINAAGVAILTSSEGYRAKRYKDSGANTKYLIGYGHQIQEGEPYGDSYVMPLTEAKALLLKDLAKYESYVTKYVKVPINSNQFSALVDFCYTIGEAAFANSKLVKALNEKDYQGAADWFPKSYTDDGKNTLPGLVIRRKSERTLFLTKDNAQEFSKKDLTFEQRQTLDKDIAKLKAQLDKVEKQIAKVKKEAKLETIKQGMDWRHIPPYTKVHLLMKDANWGSVPRFVTVFEGEIAANGFRRGVDSKNFQFTVLHITENLAMVPIMVLDPKAFTLDDITGGTQFSGITKTSEAGGGIIEKFTPQLVQEFSGVTARHLDLYNYCKYALGIWNQLISESNVKDSYHSRALLFHDIKNRIYDPNLDPQTGQPKSTDSKLQWSELYTIIMNYIFMGLLPKMGGRISFYQVMQTVAEMFLHEVSITPNPTSESNMIMIKPNNVFGPVPLCNVIYPIHGATYDFVSNFKTKPTRLVQSTQPPVGFKADLLQRYFTNLAPRSLSNKFEAYKQLTPEEKSTFQLLTDEEVERGIVCAYNDVPSFISAALTAITNMDESQTVGSDVELIGAGQGFNKLEGSAATLKKTDLVNPTPETVKAVQAKVFLHKELLVIEGFGTDTSRLPKDALKDGGKAFSTSAHRFNPLRITVVPDSTPVIKTSKFNTGKFTYTIKNGKVTRNLGRLIHIFEEPTDSIPYMLTVDEIKATIATNNKQSKFIIGDNTSSLPVMEKTFTKNTKVDNRAYVKEVANFVSGGFHHSVTILVDGTPESLNKLVRLVAILGELCGIPIPSNVRTLSDYFGSTAYVDKAKDTDIKKAITDGLGAVKGDLEKGFEKYLQQNSPNLANSTATATPAGTSPPIQATPGESTEKLDSPAGTTEETVTTEEKILSPEKQVLLESVFDRYTQPLCEYFFYLLRYQGSNLNITIAHNPFIVAGHPCFILDNSEVGLHLHAYVEQVTHGASSSGSLMTSLFLTHVRRADDLGVRDDLVKTAVPFEDTSTNTIKYPSTVAESLKDRIPFFGGEYSEANIDATFEKTIGTGRVLQGTITDKEIAISDYVTINKFVRRKMQYCKVVESGDTALQNQFNELYKNNPSRVAFTWANGEFPEEIFIIKTPREANTAITLQDLAENVTNADIFNPNIQNFIFNHTQLCNYNRAQRG